MGDQGTGGVESREVQNSTRRLSEPSPKTHDDQMQQQTSQAETPSVENEDSTAFTQSISPRVTNLSASNPTLSRNPSTSSNTSETWQEKRQRIDVTRSRTQTPDLRARLDSRAPPIVRPLEPPVTKGTLSELDVNKIVHNPKLRHDINFDPELHFRPNLDGEKGRRKQDKANQFWTTLSEQLQQFVTQPLEFQKRYGQGQDWCLPILLKSVKEIIQTLVPARDRVYLDEGLNVELIMQQFNRGIANLEKLASWLSGVLKSHCAPMRDEWVDEMYNQLTNGNRNNNMEELVQGMRSLLSVLEAMKLDVANHQIRCLRPILIEDTVHFEKRFFLKKMQTGKLDPEPAQRWYNLAKQEILPSPASRQAFGDMSVFFEALSRLVLPSNVDLEDQHQLPNTFLFDEERIYKLRSDMLDAINLEVCMRLYEKLERDYRDYDTPAYLSSLSSTPFLATPLSDGTGLVSSADDDPTEFNFNSPPNSRPCSLVFSSAGSATSSPRNSLLAFNTTTTSPAEAKAKSRNLYNSLVALLQTSPSSSRSNERWKVMQDSLALQIFRFTDAPAEVLLEFEQELHQHLGPENVDSPLFQDVEQHFHTRLLVELRQRVKEFKGLTGVGLFSAATGGRTQGTGRTRDGPRERSSERESAEGSRDAPDEAGIEDMATRLTHLGVLHWRVWSELAYQQVDMDTDMTTMEMNLDLH